MRYVGLGALSAAVLLLEITLTRIYSVTQGYHFAFLAVSLGLLGFGASGTVLFAVPALAQRLRHRLLESSALLFTVTALGSYWAINHIPFDVYRLVIERLMFLHLALFYLVQVVPFFFAGLALGGALSLEPGRAGSLYGASLVGSGVGALLALAGPAALGPTGALALVTALGALAWLAFALGNSVRWFIPLTAGALALVAGGWLLPPLVELRMSPYKALPQVLRQEGSELASTNWNPFSRVDVIRSDSLHQAPGLSFAYAGSLPPQAALTVDGDNLTSITASAPEDATFTEYLPSAVVYHLVERPRVLVIEPGGGLDVLTALHHGAVKVVGLVGNPLEADLLRGQFAQESGRVFTDPRVQVVTGNPRGYLAREDERFDVVVVSLRDAFRPLTSGAYSLLESHVYTKEAFEQYLRHLASGGTLMVTRWVQTPPSEELRVVATVVEALEEIGIAEPAESLGAIRTIQTMTVIAKKEPFAPAEIRAVRGFAASRQMDISYLPGIDASEVNRFFVLPEEVYYAGIKSLLDSRSRDVFYDQQTFDVAPATDERPFFFHFFRWRQVPEVIERLGQQWQPFGGAGFLVVLAFLVLSVLASAVLILGPLIARRRVIGRGYGGFRGNTPALVYFFALGLAFLWLELPLMQRFILLLAHPTYSFGIVLFAVLAFSGVGSLLSKRLGTCREWAILALAGTAVVYALGIGPLVEMILGLPLAARIAISGLIIAPLAFLMGIPFPSGIAALESRRRELIPWAWGANGYASVVGSVGAALVALSWGFTPVMLAAGIAYLVAWAVYYFYLREGHPVKREQI